MEKKHLLSVLIVMIALVAFLDISGVAITGNYFYITTRSTIDCYDTDGGDKPDVKGTLTAIKYQNREQTLTDYCGTFRTVIEYSCTDNKVVWERGHDCRKVTGDPDARCVAGGCIIP